MQKIRNHVQRHFQSRLSQNYKNATYLVFVQSLSIDSSSLRFFD